MYNFVQIVVSEARSQLLNKKKAVGKFYQLLSFIFTDRKVRKKTSIPYAAIRKRKESKRRRSDVKRNRNFKPNKDD